MYFLIVFRPLQFANQLNEKLERVLDTRDPNLLSKQSETRTLVLGRAERTIANAHKLPRQELIWTQYEQLESDTPDLLCFRENDGSTEEETRLAIITDTRQNDGKGLPVMKWMATSF
jgi:hypothetical protein